MKILSLASWLLISTAHAQTRSVTLIPASGVASSPIPTIQTPSLALGQTPSVLTAPSLGLMPGTALAPTLAAPVAAATPLTQTAQGVAAAIESAGDLSRIGTSDARELGGRVQALLSNQSAPSVGEGPVEPVSAKTPALAPFARLGRFFSTEKSVKRQIAASLIGTDIKFTDSSGKTRTATLVKSDQPDLLRIMGEGTGYGWLRIDGVNKVNASVTQVAYYPTVKNPYTITPELVPLLGPLMTGLNQSVFSRPEFQTSLNAVVVRIPPEMRNYIRDTMYPFLTAQAIAETQPIRETVYRDGPGVYKGLVGRYGKENVSVKQPWVTVKHVRALYRDSQPVSFDPTWVLTDKLEMPSLREAYLNLKAWGDKHGFEDVEVVGLARSNYTRAIGSGDRADTLNGTGSSYEVMPLALDIESIRLRPLRGPVD